ncbi:MAG: hypothetical protein D3910_28230, partial [Candidatus Electrothrix sp. ATG2]|nr:hypothetical protein [Candidatus Electrothrix sp. ATG2]
FGFFCRELVPEEGRDSCVVAIGGHFVRYDPDQLKCLKIVSNKLADEYYRLHRLRHFETGMFHGPYPSLFPNLGVPLPPSLLNNPFKYQLPLIFVKTETRSI